MAFPALAVPGMIGGLGWLAKKVGNSAIVTGVVAGITYMFKTKLGLFLMGAMIWLGVNWGTIKIIVEPAIDLLYGYANGVGGGGSDYATAAMQWMGVMQFDRAITMVVSAIIAKNAVMQGRLFLFKKGFGAP